MFALALSLTVKENTKKKWDLLLVNKQWTIAFFLILTHSFNLELLQIHEVVWEEEFKVISLSLDILFLERKINKLNR